MERWNMVRSLIFGACLVLLGGCAGTSAPARFYLLDTEIESETSLEVKGEDVVVISVGPVELPPYLDRPQIVTRLRPNRLHLGEFDNWAEPLQDTFARILVENLSSLLHEDRIVVLSQRGGSMAEYQLLVEVARLDNNTEGDALLTASWAIVEDDGNRILAARRSTYTESSGVRDYEAYAAGHSRNITALSRDIANAVRGQIAKRR